MQKSVHRKVLRRTSGNYWKLLLDCLGLGAVVEAYFVGAQLFAFKKGCKEAALILVERVLLNTRDFN